MSQPGVLIAGGGIGGLALALTLDQIGVKCTVFESVRELRPLGVGINLQPNAVRELHDLGIGEDELDEVGIPAREWALVGLNGKQIYSEPRGKSAGYKWHQYAVHRGRLHLMLAQKVIERLGPEALRLDHKVTGYRKEAGGSVTALVATPDRNAGVHRNAAVRRRRHPFRGPRADAPRPAADPLGRNDHVARHLAGETDPHRILVRRSRHEPPPRGVLSDLAARRERPGRHQLGRGEDLRHRSRLGQVGLVPSGRARGVRARIRRFRL